MTSIDTVVLPEGWRVDTLWPDVAQRLRAWLQGRGLAERDAVLLLHGGPGLPWNYMQALVDELCDGYRVAVYQQRGLPPSTAGAPFDVPTQVKTTYRRAVDGS